MKAVGVMIALVGALALQTTISGLTMSGGRMVNLVVVTVVCAALMFGPVAGLLAGSAGGIVQDALGGGIIGTGGLSKSVVGFLVGVLSTQFILAQPFPRFVVFAGATALHEVCFQGLHALIEGRALRLQAMPLVTQALVNASIGVAAFLVLERTPGLLQRRRARRGRY